MAVANEDLGKNYLNPYEIRTAVEILLEENAHEAFISQPYRQ